MAGTSNSRFSEGEFPTKDPKQVQSHVSGTRRSTQGGIRRQAVSQGANKWPLKRGSEERTMQMVEGQAVSTNGGTMPHERDNEGHSMGGGPRYVPRRKQIAT